MTVQEFQAKQIENGAAYLANAVASTLPDRVDWKPSADAKSDTRSALDQVAECIGVNTRFAALLSGQTPPDRTEGHPFANSAEAQEMLKASAANLASVVRGMSDDALETSHTLRFGVMTGAQLITLAANNMYYHFGQISYIQTLYGDRDFHPLPE